MVRFGVLGRESERKTDGGLGGWCDGSRAEGMGLALCFGVDVVR